MRCGVVELESGGDSGGESGPVGSWETAGSVPLKERNGVFNGIAGNKNEKKN